MISLRKTSKENLNFARRDKGLAFQIPSMYYLANLICRLWLCRLFAIVPLYSSMIYAGAAFALVMIAVSPGAPLA